MPMCCFSTLMCLPRFPWWFNCWVQGQATFWGGFAGFGVPELQAKLLSCSSTQLAGLVKCKMNSVFFSSTGQKSWMNALTKKNHLANVLIFCISSYPQQGRKNKHSYFKKSALFKFVGHGIARASPWSFSLLLEPSQSFPCCRRILWDPEQNVTGNRTESLRSRNSI